LGLEVGRPGEGADVPLVLVVIDEMAVIVVQHGDVAAVIEFYDRGRSRDGGGGRSGSLSCRV
jgi:hypothetical protein